MFAAGSQKVATISNAREFLRRDWRLCMDALPSWFIPFAARSHKKVLQHASFPSDLLDFTLLRASSTRQRSGWRLVYESQGGENHIRAAII
jgi:hypothetical protein